MISETTHHNALVHIVVPPTVEDLIELMCIATVHWRDVAEGLGFVKHRFDENYETDSRYHGATWGKLAQVLSGIGEDSLARQAGGDDVCWV